MTIQKQELDSHPANPAQTEQLSRQPPPPPQAGPKLTKAEKVRAEAKWEKTLESLHRRLDAKGTQAKAEADLDKITDPLVVSAIWKTFAGSPRHHPLIARLLGGITCSESTKALAALAVYSSDELRASAAKAMIGRDPNDFGPP